MALCLTEPPAPTSRGRATISNPTMRREAATITIGVGDRAGPFQRQARAVAYFAGDDLE